MKKAAGGRYRRGVGIALFHTDGRVFLGKRLSQGAPLPHAWQMPQGGIGRGEKPEKAAQRELHEETGIRSIEPLGEIGEWLTYDVPPPLAATAWGGRYVGQALRWFAYRFTGAESEIDLAHDGGEVHRPEFGEWRWERLARTPALVVPFKREMYRAVAERFAPFAGRDRHISAARKVP
jgi:putative (di)nucleoside polyphosphate hydrolase